ncbi:hypothetical protein P5673_004103 [Acropora cervicornis]|uniref:Uncharacterized protein n=1 Tax=Acropora cervicornis TaxID=6130 RepID=A0AAD9R1M3_ACRCE|nr:hypothetical protein P5673_004103 [Acropora cervicornis]
MSVKALMSTSCIHVTALLFRIEAANRNGRTNPACTSKECVWTVPADKTVVQPKQISDMVWTASKLNKECSCCRKGILEVKCPFCIANDIPTDLNLDYLVKINDEVTLKRKHSYYAQIQGQLGVTKRQWCHFLVYTKKGYHLERIQLDMDYWLSLVDSLDWFYLPLAALAIPVCYLRNFFAAFLCFSGLLSRDNFGPIQWVLSLSSHNFRVEVVSQILCWVGIFFCRLAVFKMYAAHSRRILWSPNFSFPYFPFNILRPSSSSFAILFLRGKGKKLEWWLAVAGTEKECPINTLRRIFNSLVAGRPSWSKTVLLSNLISLDLSFASFLSIYSLHFRSFSLQLGIFFIHSLFLAFLTLTTTTAIHATANNYQEYTDQRWDQNYENGARNPALSVVPFLAGTISWNNVRPTGIICAFLSRGTPITSGMFRTVTARRVEIRAVASFSTRNRNRCEIKNS